MTVLFYLHNKQYSPFYLNYLYRTSAIVNFSCPLGQVPPKKHFQCQLAEITNAVLQREVS